MRTKTSFAFLPNPEGMGWFDWIDAVVGYNPGLGMFAPLQKPEQRDLLHPSEDPAPAWRELAERLAQLGPNVPSPDLFDNWVDWALALKSSGGVGSW